MTEEKETALIVVSIKNKKRLQAIGNMRDSYNDVIELILNEREKRK